MSVCLKKVITVLFVMAAILLPAFADDAVTGRVMGKVLTSDGEMLVAGIVIEDEAGNTWRENTNDYGGYVLNLLPGTYKLTFDKGYEFSQYSTSVTVESYKTYYQKDVRLTQLFDSYSLGWYSGDPHQHTVYSDGLDEVADLVTANVAMGLYWGFLTDHDTSRGVPEWREATGSVVVFTDAEGNRRTFNGFAGDEVTSTFGHYQSIGTGMTFDKYEINLTEAELVSAQSKQYAREKAVYIAQQISRAGGLAQINHPYSSTNMGAMNFIAADDWEFFNCFDTMEIWNGYFICPDGRYSNKTSENQNQTAKLLWYSILNNVKNGGKFIAATGGTDDHDASGRANASDRAAFGKAPATVGDYYKLCRYERKYAGTPATYVFLDGEDEICAEDVMDALEAGNSFITNGPVVICYVGASVYGETVDADGGKVTMRTNIFDRDGMRQIRIVRNGEIIQTINLDNVVNYNSDIVVEGLESGDWFLVEVLGDYNNYAITNPFFVR